LLLTVLELDQDVPSVNGHHLRLRKLPLTSIKVNLTADGGIHTINMVLGKAERKWRYQMMKMLGDIDNMREVWEMMVE
jgi:hypothetical protein